MATSSSSSGGKFLARKSGATKARQQTPPISKVLIVEDDLKDLERLVATLNLMFGYKLDIKTAATLSTALDAAISNSPDLIFLDDVLKPSDNADDTIPYLRHAGYDGPIIVISSRATRKRKAQLARAGAIDVIHKDEVDSVRVSEALIRVFPPAAPNETPANGKPRKE